MITSVNKRISLSLICGVLCVALGCLLVKFRPQEFMINYIFTFHEGGEMYNWWLNSTAANVYLKAYAFNITNPTEFMAGQEKMKLQEVGPFLYREILTQEDAVLNDNETVTSKPRYQAVWDPKLNELDENITLYVPNVPMLSWANKVATEHPLLTIPTNTFIFDQTNSKPIQRMTWREYGFGYENSLVTLGHTLFPRWLPLDKVGLVNLLNDHSDVTSTLHTGAGNIQLSGLVDLYNGLEYLRQWPHPCNKIRNATLGLKTKTNLGDEEEFLFYFKGICRTLPFVPSSSKENKHGISTRVYKIRKDAFDNGVRNANNSCYCKNGECLPEGLSDVSDCFFGFSGVLSYPHFYNANASLLEDVEGMKPKQELHETYLRVNQETGIITEFSYRVQLNLKFADISGLKYCSPFSNMVLPLMWADIYMPSIPFRSKIQLFLLLRVQPITDFLCAFGLIFSGLYLFYYAARTLQRTRLFQRLRLKSQDFRSAIDTGQSLKGSKDRETTPEFDVHSKLMMPDDTTAI